MPKYRANESRVKLAWLCRVQPIFNEVNRDRGRRSQACLGYAMARTDDKPRGEAEFTQTIPRREGRRRSQNEGEANGYRNQSFDVNVDTACCLNYRQTVIIKKLLLSGKHPKYLDKVVINNEQAPFLQVSMAVR